MQLNVKFTIMTWKCNQDDKDLNFNTKVEELDYFDKDNQVLCLQTLQQIL
jgi:hypothetical protein